MSRESLIRELFLEGQAASRTRVEGNLAFSQNAKQICLDGTYRYGFGQTSESATVHPESCDPLRTHKWRNPGSAKFMGELCSLDQPHRSFQAYAVSIEEMNNCSKGAALVFCKEAMKYDG